MTYGIKRKSAKNKIIVDRLQQKKPHSLTIKEPIYVAKQIFHDIRPGNSLTPR